MNDEVLKATDISTALKGIVADSTYANIEMHRRFRLLSKQIIEAKTIEGSRPELEELQRLYAQDAEGLKVGGPKLKKKDRKVWVENALRRLDDLINELPEPVTLITVVPAVVRIP